MTPNLFIISSIGHCVEMSLLYEIPWDEERVDESLPVLALWSVPGWRSEAQTWALRTQEDGVHCDFSEIKDVQWMRRQCLSSAVSVLS